MDFEKVRDEIERLARQSRLWNNRKQLDLSVFSRRDFGLTHVEEVYAGRDRGGVVGDDIQKALDKVKPQRRQKETLARKVLYAIRRRWARFKIWCIQNDIVMNPDHFEVPRWLAPLLDTYVGLTNPGGKVIIHNGDFPLSGSSELLPNPNTLVEGFGTSTKLYPTANKDAFKIVPTDTNMYNVWICDMFLHDKDTTTTSTGAIHLANKTGKIFFPTINRVRIQNFYYGVYCDDPVDDNANMVIIPSLREVQIETPRNTNLFWHNVIDARVSNLWIGPSFNQVNPQIKIKAPVSISGGHYYDKVTIMKEAAWTIGDGIDIEKVNETFWSNTIVDRPDGHAIKFTDASRSKFWMFFGITCGGSGVYLDALSGLNYFFSPIFQGCTRYGIESLATAIAGNAFVFPYFETCAMGNYTFAGGSQDMVLMNDTTEWLSTKEFCFANDKWLKWIHSGGTPEQVMKLGPTDEVTIKSTRGAVHLNPDTAQNTSIAFNNTGQVAIGHGGANRPTLIQLGTTGNIELHPAGHVDAYEDIDLQAGKVLRVNNVQVVTARQAAIANVGGGGADSDGTCRAKVDAILAMLRTHGLIAP